MQTPAGIRASISRIIGTDLMSGGANVRDHRWLPMARLLPGDERAQAGGVTRVAIRWIALFGYFIDTLAHRAHQLVGGLRP
jgi:hypothetical protein